MIDFDTYTEKNGKIAVSLFQIEESRHYLKIQDFDDGDTVGEFYHLTTNTLVSDEFKTNNLDDILKEMVPASIESLREEIEKKQRVLAYLENLAVSMK